MRALLEFSACRRAGLDTRNASSGGTRMLFDMNMNKHCWQGSLNFAHNSTTEPGHCKNVIEIHRHASSACITKI